MLDGKRLILICCLTLTALAVPLPAGSEGTASNWSLVADADKVDFTGIFLVDADRAWAVARLGAGTTRQGAIYRLDLVGGKWRATPEYQASAPLNAIVATSRDDVWAVGDRGLLIQGSAGTWHQVPSPAKDADLTTIQMFGKGEEGWAAGYLPPPAQNPGPVLLHYQRGSWQQDHAIGGNQALYGLHFGPGAGWAVGSTAGNTWRYANGAWQQRERIPNCEPGFNNACAGDFRAVRTLSAGEAWAVGYWIVPCSQCRSQLSIGHYTGGSWQEVAPPQLALPAGATPGPSTSELNGVAFSDANNGLAVGQYGTANGATPSLYPLLLHFKDGTWQPEQLPATAQGDLLAVSMLDNNRSLAVGTNGLILSYGFGDQSPAVPPGAGHPTDRVGDPGDPNISYFPQVGHTLRGTFRDYWQQHGGLAQFGYPLTEEFAEVNAADNKPYVVQYFERNRFERHPENKPPYNVLLGLLGRATTAGREQEAPFKGLAAAPPGATLFFPATGHTLAKEFAGYWQSSGGLAVYGYPISEPVTETSPTDNKPYLVQYFERNRLEYHPENAPPNSILLGLLGVQVLQERGWIAK